MLNFIINHLETIILIILVIGYIMVDYWFVEILPKYGTEKKDQNSN